MPAMPPATSGPNVTAAPLSLPLQGGVPRPSILQLAIAKREDLARAYMPILKHGGLFIPTRHQATLGESIYVLVTLPEDAERHPIAGRVAWISPRSGGISASPGLGIAFPDDERSRRLVEKIETVLGPLKSSSGEFRIL